MNITNTPMYNREVGIMRNPNDNKDVMNKLIFIYSLGIDQSLVNIPYNTSSIKGDMNTLGDALRSFFTISVLKEIFTSNALNLFNTAASYSRYQKKENKTDYLVNSLLRGDSSNQYSDNNFRWSGGNDYELNNVDQQTLQLKVNQKFKEIKSLIKADVRLKKLLPFMQVITLENMVDVPVIAGTWPSQLDTGALFALLAGAISSRTKLTEMQNVNRIINNLQSMNDLSLYQAFEVLDNTATNTDMTVPSIVVRKDLPGGIPSELGRLNSEIQINKNNPSKYKELTAQYDVMKNNYAKLYISDLKDTKLKEISRAFTLMLDPERLSVKFGINPATSQSSSVTKKVTVQTELLFDRTYNQFVDFLSGADPIFLSAYMMFSPIDSSSMTWPNYPALKQTFLDVTMDNFKNFFSTLKQTFDATISQEIEKSSIAVKSINASCQNTKEEVINSINFFNRTFAGSTVRTVMGKDELRNFSESFDIAVSKFQTINEKTAKTLISFFGSDNYGKLKIALDSFITTSVKVFFDEFDKTKDPLSQNQGRIMSIVNPETYHNDQTKVISVQREVHESMRVGMNSGIQTILETMFLLIFKLNFCDYVEVLDVEFEVAKADVLDTLNYCLVLPLEVINALYVLYTKRNWKDAVIRSGAGFNPLNSSNTKGIIKTLAIQLGIPNLMVFDQKKNELYYYFKYQGSSTAEKLKMQSVDTFIKHHIDSSDAGISEVFY